MWEPVDGEGITRSVGTGDVALVAAVMFGRGANIPAVNSMGGHVGTLVRCDMDDDSGSRWGQGRLVEIERSVEAGVC
jgi:hypothetical protein